MRTLLYITAALILIAAIVPVHADQGVVGSFTLPGTLNYTYAEISAVCAPYGGVLNGEAGSQARFTNYNAAWVATGGSQTAHETYTYTNPAEVTGTTYVRLEAYCVASNFHPIKSYIYGPPPFVTANFTGTPTQGSGPLPVDFLDASTNNTYTTMTYNWSITPTTGWYPISGTINSQNLSINFVTSGNYTITHGAASTVFGSDIETKTDYIWVYNSTALETTYFDVNDIVDGYAIHGADISLYDVENTSWSNSTADADGTHSITTLSGHHINGYATATGYSPGENLNAVAWNNVHYAIMMQPSEYFNVTEGNVTLHVRVEDDMFQPIGQAGVSAQKGSGPSFTLMTNSAGTVNIPVMNNSVYRVRAEKSGYEPATQSVSTGTGSGGEDSVSVTLILYKKTVTPTVTQTTLPGGGTPVPTLTYLANCDPNAADYDATKCRQSHSNSGLNFLAENMLSLIELCVMVTILYLFGVKLGR